MKKQNVRTLSFIVSTFTYLLIGAAIFDALESQTEESTRVDLENTEIDYKNRYNISNEEYKSLEDVVIKYHPYRTFPQWKFTGAFYFSLTVITTIGYGHSTPQTVLGKIFCMLYAIVGIPLCLIMFQSVGERLNYFSSFCIQLLKKCSRIKNTEVNQTEMFCAAVFLAMVVITGGAAMFSHFEGWTYFDSIYYCVITLTTIGFGDFVDKNNLSNTIYVILSFTFILFGLTVVASSINLFVLKFLTMNTDDERREYSRKNQEINDQKIKLSTGDLVNGNLINKYQPNDIEELKKENAIRFCFTNSKSISSIIENKFKTIKFVDKTDMENENVNRKLSNLNNNDLKELCILNFKRCPTCFFTTNRKKTHYTITRGPSKISHLLITDNNNSSIKDRNEKKESLVDSITNDTNINLNFAINQYIDEEL